MIESGAKLPGNFLAYFNTARVSLASLEKAVILFANFLESCQMTIRIGGKSPTSNGVKLQLLPSLTNPRIEEK